MQPIMVFNPAKLAAASRAMMARGVAIVVVGFPATPLLTSRMRVCVSASHTREDLDFALEVFEEVRDRWGSAEGGGGVQGRGPEGMSATGLWARTPGRF